MGKFLESIAKDTKKIGRFAALIIVLYVAGSISMNMSSPELSPDVIVAMAKVEGMTYDKIISLTQDLSNASADRKMDLVKAWLQLAGYAIMFYFLVNKSPQKP